MKKGKKRKKKKKKKIRIIFYLLYLNFFFFEIGFIIFEISKTIHYVLSQCFISKSQYLQFFFLKTRLEKMIFFFFDSNNKIVIKKFKID